MRTGQTGQFSDSGLSAQSRFVDPGAIIVAPAPMTLAAVLGTAVAVCCWDRHTRSGGLAHFTAPATRDPHSATARYGNVAIRHLIRLLTAGATRPADLVGHILGGAANPPAGDAELAARNVRCAENILRRSGVRILSRDTGGRLGRKVVFDVSTGNVAILKVERLRRSDWHQAVGR